MNTTHDLNELKDIHLPDPVSGWPPALGWWLVAGLLIISAIAGYWAYKTWHKNAYKRQAIKRIRQLFITYPSQPTNLAEQLNKTLKAVAQQSYPHAKTAHLTATPWLTFLDQSANMQSFRNGPGAALATLPYQDKAVLENSKALQKCCIEWVRRHTV